MEMYGKIEANTEIEIFLYYVSAIMEFCFLLILFKHFNLIGDYVYEFYLFYGSRCYVQLLLIQKEYVTFTFGKQRM